MSELETAKVARSEVPGAGGVVLRAGAHLEALLVRYRSGAWAFPKGHLEAGETPQQAAVREVAEEAGVAAVVLAPLGPTRYTNDRGQAREIQWFLMRPEGESGVLEDTFSEGGFFALEEAAALLTYSEDRALLSQAAGALPSALAGAAR